MRMKIKLKIQGMHCNSCAMRIEQELEDKVNKIKVNFSSESAEIDFNPEKITEKEIKKEIENLGYKIR
jgi:copper chaperone CopZ